MSSLLEPLIGVIAFSAHKELAKEFIDFLVSKKGQDVCARYGCHS